MDRCDVGRPRRLLLFGGTRGTGLEVARLARARDWDVVALARITSSPDALNALGCTVVIGDALEPSCILDMMGAFGQGARVVSSLGGGWVGASADYRGTANVVDGMIATGLGRLVLVSSLGAGESRSFASAALLARIGAVLEEKSRAEAHATAAGLDLTIVRPGRLLTAAPTGRGALFDDPRVHGSIGRADLASLVLRCLDDSGAIGRTLAAVDRDTLTGPAGLVSVLDTVSAA